MGLTGLYRVDTVPLWLKPIFWIYSYGVGYALAFYGLLVRATSQIEILNESGMDWQADTRVIVCAWHQYVWCQFIAFTPLGRYAALSHPHWYMEPVYVMLRALGMRKFILGSSGNEGRAAAENLVTCLKAGPYSAVINPDGPAGPALKLKKGVLFIAAQSGLPIVPARFECSAMFRLPGWDRKWMPLPFGKITVRLGLALKVHLGEELGEKQSHLAARLGG